MNATFADHVASCEQCYLSDTHCPTGVRLFADIDDDTDHLIESLARKTLAQLAR